jgi:hypothetical protein
MSHTRGGVGRVIGCNNLQLSDYKFLLDQISRYLTLQPQFVGNQGVVIQDYERDDRNNEGHPITPYFNIKQVYFLAVLGPFFSGLSDSQECGL